MPRAGSSERAGRTRSRLLAAAVEAFAERGFHGTTTRDIAEAAGVSTAALYVHHDSKEELLYEISKAGHEETLTIVRAAADSSSDPVEQLRALVSGYVAFHIRKHTIARIINYELAALRPDHHADIARIRREIDKVIHDLMNAGVTAGLFRTPQPRMTAVAIESMGIDIARWYRDGVPWSSETIADGYVEMAMRLVGI